VVAGAVVEGIVVGLPGAWMVVTVVDWSNGVVQAPSPSAAPSAPTALTAMRFRNHSRATRGRYIDISTALSGALRVPPAPLLGPSVISCAQCQCSSVRQVPSAP
jgi:hypothetical protein